MSSTCPCCGSPVEVISSDEGTSYYRPIESEMVDHLADVCERLSRSLAGATNDTRWRTALFFKDEAHRAVYGKDRYDE